MAGRASANFELIPLEQCMLSFQELGDEPVVTHDGYVYDNGALQTYLMMNNRHPGTGEELRAEQIHPLHVDFNSSTGRLICAHSGADLHTHMRVAVLLPTGRVANVDLLTLGRDPEKQEAFDPQSKELCQYVLINDPADPAKRRPESQFFRSQKKLAKVQKKKKAAPGPDSATLAERAKAERAQRELAVREEVRKRHLHGFVTITTSHGAMNFNLYCQEAPETCERFLKLCREGIYNASEVTELEQNVGLYSSEPDDLKEGDTTPFLECHEVMRDKLTQSLKFDQGGYLTTTGDAESRRFMLTFKQADRLNGRCTPFGKLVKGKEVLQGLNLIRTFASGKPREPVRIEKVEVRQDPFEDVRAEFALGAQKAIVKAATLLNSDQRVAKYILKQLEQGERKAKKPRLEDAPDGKAALADSGPEELAGLRSWGQDGLIKFADW